MVHILKIVDERHKMWSQMYEAELVNEQNPVLSLNDSYLLTPNKGQSKSSITILPRAHSSIQRMFKLPSPPKDIKNKQPSNSRSSCRVLTSAENLRNIENLVGKSCEHSSK